MSAALTSHEGRRWLYLFSCAEGVSVIIMLLGGAPCQRRRTQHRPEHQHAVEDETLTNAANSAQRIAELAAFVKVSSRVPRHPLGCFLP